MNYLIILVFTFYFCTTQYLVSQAIPKNHLSFQTKKFLFDAGKNWDLITNFNPIRYSKHKTSDNDLDDRSSLIFRLGFLSLNENTTLYSYTNFSYDKFYLYSYSNFINKESREFLSKNKSKIKNFQDNISGLGYQNNWLNIQFGSGQEGWGLAMKLN